MDNIFQSNDDFIKYLLSSFPNFKELVYVSNTLTWQGKSINLDACDLVKIWNETYLHYNIESLSSEDIYNIFYIHANYNSYFNLARNFTVLMNSNRVLTPEENNLISNFNSYIYLLIKYRDYLTSYPQNFLDMFIKTMLNYDMASHDNKINANQQRELDIYNDMENKVWDEINQKNRKSAKEDKKRQRVLNIAGVGNAFLVILVTSALGILICSLLLVAS